MSSCISIHASGHTSIVSPSLASYTFSIGRLPDFICFFPARTASISPEIGRSSSSELRRGFPEAETSVGEAAGRPVLFTMPPDFRISSSSSLRRCFMWFRKATLKPDSRFYRFHSLRLPARPAHPGKVLLALLLLPCYCVDTEFL